MHEASWVVPWFTQTNPRWRRPPSLILEKISITPDSIKISAPNFMGRRNKAMQRWPSDQKLKPEVNSRDVIKWKSEALCASISVTITDIWTKFGTEHKYHTANTPEWPNSHKLKIQDGCGRYLKFRKSVNNFGLDKDILHQIIWEDASRRRGDKYVTKSRNRKLIRVTSSNECLKHTCVDLSDYNRYLNQIWYRT